MMPDDAHVRAWRDEVQKRMDSCERLMLKLVKASWKWDWGRCRWEDLEAVGHEALWRACVFFEPERGLKLTTLVGLAVKRDVWRAIKAVAKRRDWEVSFSVLSPRGDDDRGRANPVHRRVNPMTEALWTGPEPAVDASSTETRDLVKRILGKLPARSAYVLRRRWLEGATLREVGAELGVTHERVRQIERQAIQSARRFLPVREAGEAEVE